MGYPIILIHKGDSPYLAYAIAQAKTSNPESKIILLGDKGNSYYLGVEHYYYEQYFSEAKKFSESFEYKYFPSYQHSWILFCHQKYFFLREFCKLHQIKQFLLIDSDVMIYDRIDHYFVRNADVKMTVVCANPDHYQAGAWISFINDSSILDKLCAIYSKLFSENGESIRSRLNLKFLNEMVGLFILMEENPTEVKNLYSYEELDYVISLSMQYDNRFEFEGEFSKILWKGVIPYVIKRGSGGVLKSPFLHFHGKGKYVMRKYLKSSDWGIHLQALANRLTGSALKYPRRIINMISRVEVYPKI
jgi:hypothetical protein